MEWFSFLKVCVVRVVDNRRVFGYFINLLTFFVADVCQKRHGWVSVARQEKFKSKIYHSKFLDSFRMRCHPTVKRHTHFSLQITFHFNTFKWQSSYKRTLRHENRQDTYQIILLQAINLASRGLPLPRVYIRFYIKWNVSVSITVFVRQWGVIYLPLKRNLHVLKVYMWKETRLTVVTYSHTLGGSTLIILHVYTRGTNSYNILSIKGD